MTHVQKVKWLRANIEEVEKELKKLCKVEYRLPINSIHNSITHNIEAGMWLGQELGRIRDEK